jgi:ribosomal protein L29
MTKLRDLKNEIKVLDIAALVAKSKALKIEINDLVLDKNMNKLKDLKSISKKKKELARVQTVLSQKSMIAKLEPKEEKAEEKKSEEKEAKKK